MVAIAFLTADFSCHSPGDATEADTSDLDQLYAYDDVNRLVQSEEGTLSAGKDSISSLNFNQQWSLDATGNWSGFKEDDDGDSTWDLEQTRTSNKVNEITDVAETTGPSWTRAAYNRAGNMTAIPQPGDPTQSYAATYDAWNRLVKLEDGEDTVAEYVFDGAKRLVVRKKYASGSLSQTRHFYHTAQWQTIEERLESGGSLLSTADRQFTWGQRYIDDLVCRTTNSTHDYAYQDANWNVILSSTTLARVVYQPYGQIRSTCPAASGDLDTWQHYFAGYRRDEDTGLYLVRHRVYQPALGCWVQRDPMGYGGKHALYDYARTSPLTEVDPLGLIPIIVTCIYSEGYHSKEIEVNCGGLAVACAKTACNSLGTLWSWDGTWRAKGIWGANWKLDIKELCRQMKAHPGCAGCCCQSTLAALLDTAREHSVPDFPDTCMHWVDKFPRHKLPKNYRQCFSLENRLFEYDYRTPAGRLRHCAIKVTTCNNTVFYLDSNWWGGSDHYFAPEEIYGAKDVGQW